MRKGRTRWVKNLEQKNFTIATTATEQLIQFVPFVLEPSDRQKASYNFLNLRTATFARTASSYPFRLI